MSPAAGNTSHLLSLGIGPPYSPQLHLPSVMGTCDLRGSQQKENSLPAAKQVAVGRCAHVPRCRKGARSGQRPGR